MCLNHSDYPSSQVSSGHALIACSKFVTTTLPRVLDAPSSGVAPELTRDVRFFGKVAMVPQVSNLGILRDYNMVSEFPLKILSL